ncbi:MAG TPA: hypothetical protein DHW65_02020 [Dehalococcoidia bacterium]|nr:hypothetical protein [Chloroflexota bacterium]HAA94552.1 hypothetical protein [Dehalococcoidia bacterium]HCL25109.1 hypothetical protein [Dehalococcoidia bacterium]
MRHCAYRYQGVPSKLQITPGEDIRDKLGPFLLPIGRTIVGVCLGLVLSMTGIGVAWALFIFFGFSSANVWLGWLYAGAGLGAGTACFFAWLRLDREEMLVLVCTALAVVGTGIVGAWIGFEYGSTQEIECCAMPTKSPIYYTSIGATAAANIGGVAVAAVRTLTGK